MHIAPFDKRIIAYFIDLILAAAISGVIFFIIPGPITFLDRFLLMQAGGYVLYALGTTAVLLISNGFTLGSALLKLRVVRLNDQRMDLTHSLIRGISLAVFPWVIINALNMLFVHTERTIFDRLSDTIVIDKRC